ncbi:MAG TPA: hypothetical protein VFH70_00950 [Acidimicrobiales bacterium]|nr:hypothetical protein [Acidimicrobiales bacterium]
MSQCHDVYPTAHYVSSQPRPVSGAQCHDGSYHYDDQPVEVVLANAVRDWVERIAPGDEPTIRAGVETALYVFASGASVSEACEEARSTVLCRLRHPSHARPARTYATAS